MTTHAPASLSDPTLTRALEGARQRYAGLAQALERFYVQIAQSDPLPPWSALQQAAAVISTTLSSATDHLAANHDLFAATSAYPLPDAFGPAAGGQGQTQQFRVGSGPLPQDKESILLQLLRKKLEPAVQDWIAEGRENAVQHTRMAEDVFAPGSPDAGVGLEAKPSMDDYQELWKWALSQVREIVGEQDYGRSDYTKAEREDGVEKVKHGLKRKLVVEPPKTGDEDEDDDEDEFGMADEGDEDEDNMPVDDAELEEVQEPITLNRVLKFMTTGVLPPPPPEP